MKRNWMLFQNFRWKSALHFSQEILLASRFRQTFNGVTQHGARHLPVMLLQERFLDSQIALADFAEHPAGGFVDEMSSSSFASSRSGGILIPMKTSPSPYWPGLVLKKHWRVRAVSSLASF